MPCLSRRLVPRLIDGLDGHDVRFLHFLNGMVNQLAGNTVPPEIFTHIYSVYDAGSPRFDHGRNRLPVIKAPDKEPRHRSIVSGDISEAGTQLEPYRQPAHHSFF